MRVSGLRCQKCTFLFPPLPFCFRALHEHALAHLDDVALLDKTGDLLGDAILLEAELFAKAQAVVDGGVWFTLDSCIARFVKLFSWFMLVIV